MFTTELAAAKAHSLLDGTNLSGATTILGADTVVLTSRGVIFGQPENLDHARHMLTQLMNGTHRVVTAVALVSVGTGGVETFADSTRVHLGRVEIKQVEAYLHDGKWMGKAGGYNLFELREIWPFTFDGDPTTVVGLPMQSLAPALARRSIAPERLPGSGPSMSGP